MPQDEVLRLVAKTKDEASGPLRKIRDAMRAMKEGNEGPLAARKAFREWNSTLKETHEHIDKVGESAKRGLEPALDMLNLKTAVAAGGIATLVEGLKHFAERGDELIGFSHKARLSVETIRGFEGIAEKFHVDPAELRQTEMSLTDSMYRIRKHRGDFYAYLHAQRPRDAAALAATPDTEEGNERALRVMLGMLAQIRKERGEATARIFSKENLGSDALVDLVRDGLPALDEAIAKYRELSGPMDVDKSEEFVKTFADFKGSLEGLENTAGADFLPKITEGVKGLTEYVSGHKGEIEDGVVTVLRDVGQVAREAWPPIKEVASAANEAAIAMGGWGHVLEAYVAFKLAGYAYGFVRLAGSVRGLARAFERLTAAGRTAGEAVGEAAKTPQASVTGRKPTGQAPVEVEIAANDNGLVEDVKKLGGAAETAFAESATSLGTFAMLAQWARQKDIIKLPPRIAGNKGDAPGYFALPGEAGYGFHPPDDDRATRSRASDVPAPSATDAIFTLGSLGQDVKILHGSLKDFAAKHDASNIVPASFKPGEEMGSSSAAEDAIASGTYKGVLKALVDFTNQNALDKPGVVQASFTPGGAEGAGFSGSARALRNAGSEFTNGRPGSVGSGDGTSTTDSAGPGFTAGMRARNLGNIGYFGQKDAGLVGPSNSRDVDHSIAMYATQEDGIRAAARLALRKYQEGMRNTAALIAGPHGWTPGALGPGASVNIAKAMGLSNQDDLHLDQPAQMHKFLRGLAMQEHGKSGSYYNDAMIDRALTGSSEASAGSAGNGKAVDLAEHLLGANGMQAAAALHSKMTPGEWCADFVNGVLKGSGGRGVNSSLASSFRDWGTEVAKASIKRGDVLVEKGHVGIATGETDQHGRIGMVSGNYGHQVGRSWESPDSIIAARRAAVDAAAPAPGLLTRQPGELTRKSQDADVHRVHGTGALTVDVNAPRGTKVAATGGGLFQKVELNRGYSMTQASEDG